VPCVFNFDAAAIKCRLRQESNFRIEFAKLHILMIAHFEFPNPAAATIRVE
jgi:diacylglycerol kinase